MARFIGFAILVTLVCVASPVSAQGLTEIPADSAGYRSSSSGEHSWQTIKYRNIRVYAPRPATIPSQLRVKWADSKIDPLGNFVTLHGRVEFRTEATWKAVNWFQGIAVHMANAPDVTPDWSSGPTEFNAETSNNLLKPTGTFDVTFDLRNLAHNHRLSGATYHTGIALAEHVGTNDAQSVTWSSKSLCHKSTTGTVDIGRSAPLSEPLGLINAACNFNASNTDLIRAVNGLHGLGKDKTIALLKQYLALSKDHSSLDDQFGVFWIIRLLFEPIEDGAKIPVPGIWVYGPKQEDWPLTPMTMLFSVPFQFRLGGGFGGLPEHPTSHIRWATASGRLRDRPLAPIDPLSAVEFLIRSKRFQRADKRASASDLRGQAIRMLELRTMPQVDPELREKLLDSLNSPWKSLSKPFEKTLLKKFRWEAELKRFVPKEYKESKAE